MYERSAIVLEKNFNTILGFDQKTNLKTIYKDFKELAEEIENYQQILDLFNSVICLCKCASCILFVMSPADANTITVAIASTPYHSLAMACTPSINFVINSTAPITKSLFVIFIIRF